MARFFLGLPVALLVFPIAAWAETLSIRTDAWFPVNGDPDAERPGYMIELAREILAPHGVQVDYRQAPWRRSLADVRRGVHDCVVGAVREEVPEFVLPEEPWGVTVSSFYVRHDSDWRFEGRDSLDALRLAKPAGYDFGRVISEFVESHPDQVEEIHGNKAQEQTIQMVLAGHADATVENQNVMMAKLEEMDLVDKLKSAGQIRSPRPIYIACSPARATSDQYVKWFDEGIHELRESGRLDDLLARYGLTDWKN